VPIFLKSGSLNLPEPSGPFKGYNGIGLFLPFTSSTKIEACKKKKKKKKKKKTTKK
jgi:hypothetical protein